MMSKSRTITGTAGAWLLSAYGPQDLNSENTSRIVGSVISYSNSDMTTYGWTRIGEATITVTIPDEKTLVENKVESLRAEQTKTLADAQAKATQIEKQIQTLLAITYDGSAE